MTLPPKLTLTEQDIRHWVGDTSLTRGKPYAQQGAIQSSWLQGNLLKAQCWGSSSQPYRLSVQFGAQGIEQSACSCPVGDSGRCKHVAALLLTWLATPAKFREVEPLDEVLGRLEKENIIQLVQQMVARYPDLEEMIHLSLAPSASTSNSKNAVSISPDLIRQQMERILRQANYGHDRYGAMEDIVAGLETILAQSSLYEKKGDWLNAAVIHQTVVAELLQKYDQIYDHDGDLAIVIHTASERLGYYLDHIQQPETRLTIWRTLLDIIVEDILMGGYGLSDGAYEVLAESPPTATERRSMVTWVEEAFAKQKPEENPSLQWKTNGFGRLLLHLQADDLSDEQYLAICRRTKLRMEAVQRLLKRGRLEDAITETRQTPSDYELLGLANHFVAQGQGQTAEMLVLERVETSQDLRLADWLQKRALEAGDWGTAVRYAETLFWKQPRLHLYQELKQIAGRVGDWDTRRTAVIAQLTTQQNYRLLTEIYVVEEEGKMALSTLAQLTHPSPTLMVAVAAVAEKSVPRESIRLYLEVAEGQIKLRGRESYVSAAGYLKRGKKLYEELGETAVWKSYIDELRKRESRLKALKEELARAGI